MVMASDNSSTDGCSSQVNSATEEAIFLGSFGGGIALLVILSLLSVATIIMFIHSYVGIRHRVKSQSRRIFLIRLFAIFPIYSATSLAGVYFPRASLITGWGSSLYLSMTMYTFVLLVIDYYGGLEAMERHLEGVEVSLSAPPLTCCCPCLPKVVFMDHFHGMRVLVLQAVYLRPLTTIIGAILWTDGIYAPRIGPDSAFLYLTIISLISSLVAVYGLSVMYNATLKHLRHFMIGVKFAVLKCVIIVTNLQNMIIAALSAANAIPCSGAFNSPARGTLIYHILVICEMFLILLVLKIYYAQWSKKHEYGKHFSSKASVGDLKPAAEEKPPAVEAINEGMDDVELKAGVNGESKSSPDKSDTGV
nr:organic solute transporter subunit alpha-like [Lytechinus pictus]XP_054753353.1 organic solute transporter subunit alpha-like [Lytechinus pictus]